MMSSMFLAMTKVSAGVPACAGAEPAASASPHAMIRADMKPFMVNRLPVALSFVCPASEAAQPPPQGGDMMRTGRQASQRQWHAQPHPYPSPRRKPGPTVPPRDAGRMSVAIAADEGEAAPWVPAFAGTTSWDYD